MNYRDKHKQYINFDKYRMLCTLIEEKVVAYQHHQYNFEVVPSIQNYFKQPERVLSTAEMDKQSKRIEPPHDQTLVSAASFHGSSSDVFERKPLRRGESEGNWKLKKLPIKFK